MRVRVPLLGCPSSGDDEAVAFVCELIKSHGFVPVKRGGLDVAEDMEVGATKAAIEEMKKGNFAASMQGRANRVKSGEPVNAERDQLSDLGM